MSPIFSEAPELPSASSSLVQLDLEASQPAPPAPPSRNSDLTPPPPPSEPRAERPAPPAPARSAEALQANLRASQRWSLFRSTSIYDVKKEEYDKGRAVMPK